MSNEAKKLELYTKVAKYLVAGMPEKQIAEALDVSPSYISNIKAEPEFTGIHGKLLEERITAVSEVNDGWDSLEQASIGILQSNLKYNKNPDFALRVAMIANKAQRRGQRPLIPTAAPLNSQQGQTIVLNFGEAYVNKLKRISVGEVHPNNVSAQPLIIHQNEDGIFKATDMMPPSSVEKVLSGKEDFIEDISMEDLDLSA